MENPGSKTNSDTDGARTSADDTVSDDEVEGATDKEDAEDEQWKVLVPNTFSGATFPCQICGVICKSKASYEAHQVNHIGPFLKCEHCDFETAHESKLNKHMSRHTGENLHYCPYCNFTSPSKGDVNKHKVKHFKARNHKCPIPGCSFATKYPGNIKHHMRVHTEDRPYQCAICDQTFKRQCDINYHMFRRHNEEKPKACDECDFRCKTNFELNSHKLKHSDVRNFPCTFPGCGRWMKCKSDLTKHMNTHTKEKKYECPDCGKAFTTSGSLRKHRTIHQLDIKPQICELCHKCLRTKASLNSHMKRHAGIMPFECPVCCKKFSNKSNMNAHLKTHESVGRPFPCPICPYTAKQTHDLLAHIGSFHGDTYAYFCQYCNKPWKRWGQLQIHLRRMHPEKIDPSTHDLNITIADALSPEEVPIEVTEIIAELGLKTPKIIKREFPLKVDPSETMTENHSPMVKIMKIGNLTIPLATKGFKFNYDKNGKKPRSWFMEPKNMDERAAVKQEKYMRKCTGISLRGKNSKGRPVGSKNRRKAEEEEEEDYDFKPDVDALRKAKKASAIKAAAKAKPKGKTVKKAKPIVLKIKVSKTGKGPDKYKSVISNSKTLKATKSKKTKESGNNKPKASKDEVTRTKSAKEVKNKPSKKPSSTKSKKKADNNVEMTNGKSKARQKNMKQKKDKSVSKTKKNSKTTTKRPASSKKDQPNKKRKRKSSDSFVDCELLVDDSNNMFMKEVGSETDDMMLCPVKLENVDHKFSLKMEPVGEEVHSNESDHLTPRSEQLNEISSHSSELHQQSWCSENNISHIKEELLENDGRHVNYQENPGTNQTDHNHENPEENVLVEGTLGYMEAQLNLLNGDASTENTLLESDEQSCNPTDLQDGAIFKNRGAIQDPGSTKESLSEVSSICAISKVVSLAPECEGTEGQEHQNACNINK